MTGARLLALPQIPYLLAMANNKHDAVRENMRKMGRVGVAEAAKLAQVSDTTIRSWARDGVVGAVFYAQSWWISKADLMEVSRPLRERA